MSSSKKAHLHGIYAIAQAKFNMNQKKLSEINSYEKIKYRFLNL